VTIWDLSNLSSGIRDGYPGWLLKDLSKDLEQLALNWFSQNYIRAAHIAGVLTEDEARRRASNIAELPNLLAKKG
jgi:hypothetical protein